MMAMDLPRGVDRFASAAASYCAWIESPSASPVADMRTALQLLTSLYGAALFLPEVASLGAEEPLGNARIPKKDLAHRFDSLPSRYYASCFDPWEREDTPVVADLVDDLFDIYFDLQRGSAALASVGWQEAVWHWRDSFVSHWGRHAVSALKALHGLALAQGWTEVLEAGTGD